MRPFGPYGRLAQLPYAAVFRPARSSGGPCNRCLATTGRRRLSGKHQPLAGRSSTTGAIELGQRAGISYSLSPI